MGLEILAAITSRLTSLKEFFFLFPGNRGRLVFRDR